MRLTGIPISEHNADFLKNARSDVAALLKEVERLNNAIDDFKENGFCSSCGQKICHFRNHEITYCVDWQWRGLKS